MDTDWYCTSSMYGYAFQIPEDTTYGDFLEFVFRLHKLEPPFEIVGLLSVFHSQMQGEDNDELDRDAKIVLGFSPQDDLDETAGLILKLKKNILPLFKDYEMLPGPKFYTGIEWRQPFTFADE
jgi:hypothetical protein